MHVNLNQNFVQMSLFNQLSENYVKEQFRTSFAENFFTTVKSVTLFMLRVPAQTKIIWFVWLHIQLKLSREFPTRSFEAHIG